MKKPVRQRKIAAFLALLLFLGAPAGCGRTKDLSGTPGGGKWVDSDVAGVVTADDTFRLQDDFAAAVNQDFIVSSQFDPDDGAIGAISSAQKLVFARYREVLADKSIKGANAKVLRTYEDLSLNWEERNKRGVEPLRPYIDAIKSIETIDDLTAWQGSTERNPFGLGLMMPAGVIQQLQYPEKSTLSITIPALSLGAVSAYSNYNEEALRLREVTDDTVRYLLDRLGESDPAIKEVLTGNYRIETFLARHSSEEAYNADESFKIVQNTRKGLAAYTEGYPLLKILDERGYDRCNSFNLDVMQLASLSEIYTPENLEDLKAFLIVHTINAAEYLLDRASMETVLKIQLANTEEADKEAFPDDDEIFGSYLSNANLLPAMDEIYLEKYFPGHKKVARIEKLIENLTDSYRQMIGEEDWLSGETRDAAIEKLNNMAVHVVKPDNKADYADADIKGYKKGGTLLDAAAEGHRVMEAHMAEKSADPTIDRYFWDIYDMSRSTTTVNCFYASNANAFYILAGFVAVADVLFEKNASFEEFAGCIGAVAGHEISHGFDANGSQADLYGRSYDENGHSIDWMTVDDRSRLDERAGRLASYFSLARPIPGKRKVVGANVNNEAMADMAGIKANLYLAKKRPDFDYDAFFRAYATLWAEQQTEKDELAQMEADEHPLHFHRINITLQQFDEFLETYAIGPGDGMYLEPERRVSVW